MGTQNLTGFLWGKGARLSVLLIGSALLLFTCLGGKELWTQEHRWADIVAGMFYRHDFFHPYLGENQYYDKPLLSYWLIALFSLMSGELTTTVLRLPSALAALLAIYSIYLIGKKLKDKEMGLLSAWMLITTYYFLFWGRTSSADMLNLSGTFAAIAWYFYRCERPKFFDYAVFYIILAFTSLCKGLIGSIIPLIAVFVDMCLRKTLLQHLKLRMFLAIVPALFIYLTPFLLSSYFDGQTYGQNGLYLVYRENFQRYFQPFDHQGSIFTYFIYLPIYLMPWALFLMPALWQSIRRYQTMNLNSKWIFWSLCCLFLFLTLSGSRRSYYVLPLVPFGILLIANWLTIARMTWHLWVSRLFLASFLFLFVAFDLVTACYYAYCGVGTFASVLKTEVEKQRPWNTWNIMMLDPESKVVFYLHLPPDTKVLDVDGKRENQTMDTLLKVWPVLKNKPSNTIFITRRRYEPMLKPFFAEYAIVALRTYSYLANLNAQDDNAPIAFVPRI